MLSMTKIFEFNAAHHLPYHQGKCNQLHGHGFRLEVTIDQGEEGMLEGIELAGIEAGMIMDFSRFKERINQLIISHLDHKNLNDTIKNPTAENIVSWILGVLLFDFPTISRIKLYETPTSYVEWRK